MKPYAYILGCLLLLASCTRADMSEEEQAAAYIQSLESSQAIAADEYARMVSFYCDAMDRHYDSLEPHVRAYADAVTDGRTEAADSAAQVLHNHVMALTDKQVVKLGNSLASRAAEMPDSTSRRFNSFVQSHVTRLSDYR